jgi:hypothetical protein
MANTKNQTAMRAMGALESEFRRHAAIAVDKIIIMALANPNRKLTVSAQDCLELLVTLGGANISKSGLSDLTDKLEDLQEALDATAATPKKRGTKSS